MIYGTIEEPSSPHTHVHRTRTHHNKQLCSFNYDRCPRDQSHLSPTRVKCWSKPFIDHMFAKFVFPHNSICSGELCVLIEYKHENRCVTPVFADLWRIETVSRANGDPTPYWSVVSWKVLCVCVSMFPGSHCCMRTHLSSVVLRLHGFLSDCWVPLCLKKQMPADIACVCGPGDTCLSVSRSHQMWRCGNICIRTEGGSLREDILDKKGGSMSKTGGLTLPAINI